MAVGEEKGIGKALFGDEFDAWWTDAMGEVIGGYLYTWHVVSELMMRQKSWGEDERLRDMYQRLVFRRVTGYRRLV